MKPLSDFTPARVALGRAGHALPTAAHLAFQAAHAQARDAVHLPLDVPSLILDLRPLFPHLLAVSSAAPSRDVYLRRPDLGRRLAPASESLLASHHGPFDAAFIVADGLSALAVHRHARGLLDALLARLPLDAWRLAPLVVATQARVALGDPIASLLGASLAVVLIGERPGLSSPDSLGVYLTWNPAPGRTDAERNCISNIRAEGLSYPAAAHKLLFLMTESRRRKLSGVPLKEEAGLLEAGPPTLIP
jgi:ethanolamine ammonia-lyase small subunit